MTAHQERLAAFMAAHKQELPTSVVNYARILYKVDPMNPDPGRSKPRLIWWEHHIDAMITIWTDEYLDVPKPLTQSSIRRLAA